MPNLLFQLVEARWLFGGAPAEKASLLGFQFDSKQCREQFVTLCLVCPQSRYNSLAFQTSVLLGLLLDLDAYGGVDPLGVFPLFLKKVADIIAPKLSIIFRQHIRLGSFSSPPEVLRCMDGILYRSARL